METGGILDYGENQSTSPLRIVGALLLTHVYLDYFTIE
jgi:hypothetical protein